MAARLILLLLLAMTLGPLAQAQGWRAELPQKPNDSTAHVAVRAELSTGGGAVAPGGSLVVAVVLEHDPGWHTHTQAPVVPPALGDASLYIATAVAVEPDPGAPLAAHAGFTAWPEPEVVEVAFLDEPVDYAVFGGVGVVYVPVTVAADAAEGVYPLAVAVTLQACDDTRCMRPVRGATLPLEVEVKAGAASGTPPPLFDGFDPGVWAEIHAGTSPAAAGPAGGVGLGFFGRSVRVDPAGWAGFAALLLLAASGGLLLNLTPCVLPVLPIKAMGLAAKADSRGQALAAGLLTGVGIVGFWLALGAAIASLTGLDAVHSLFQRPLFTLGVGAVIAVLAVGMAGWFTIPLPRAVYAVDTARGGWLGHLLLGVMTAVLSTPCTAPFMGSAAAWATTRPAGVTLAVFAAIGVGMALPYVLLAAFPKLVAWVPRAGPGAAAVKQVMALAMLAAAAYFVGAGLLALGARAAGHAAWFAIPWLLVAAAAVAAWKAWRHARGRAWPVVFSAVAAATLAGAAWFSFAASEDEPIDWIAYEPGVLERLAAEDRVAVIDFTADWCINCKVLERTVLFSDAVSGLADGGVAFVKVDLTGSNAAGEALLADAGRVAIPALLVRAPDGRVTLNSEAYTAGQVVDAARRASDAHRRP
ncbi:protein-disulfide reductase DsbD family protein [Phycisphaera mikurensis]|uniref:Thioredoxin domain-containing protein n=1 Tax=Phycisphaera mikurensis (strain NBRC 102666 / KCTC 22515 / FYK2301M01) TaxID=1142394 RepID=I0IGH9_PHYMF|nr:cytochrome c biogenesis protein CcdA [Phycisphaera mikurensis]MBB6442952.1 thiol:disulfide interchange protein DsbD [Phycisphaera mikurensis]BAM04367.1 hypothetical protein PSMK_22080 [Phycisphaera mikurensis NBRC 102666]